MDRMNNLYTSIKNIFKISIFEFAIRALIILLPFTTILSVFTSQKLGIPWFTYYKELLLILWLGYITWNHVHGKLSIKWWWVDVIIVIYVLYLVLISFGTTGLWWIIYGGRYDFEFLMAFWITYHGAPLLEKPLSYYLKIFLISCGAMLFVSGLLKFPLSEDLLLYVGYSGNPSAWQFWSAPPIFDGIDGANVRRFQGILDWPNTMWAFLIMFSWFFAYYIRGKKPWYFVNGLILIGLIVMILYTYSRSALLGIIAAYGIATIAGMTYLFKHYKKQFITIILLGTLIIGVIWTQFSGTVGAIINRAGSTQWHAERMITSIKRFESRPLGQWLGSSGPWYRYTQNLESLKRTEIEEKDRFYIPESWYIQQFVEGWAVWWVLFLALMLIFFIQLFKKHPILGGMFAGIGIMNFFLHTFESSPFALLFFLLIGIILSERTSGNHVYKR